ncbi:MAG: primosomal protein N' [Candidatus Bipolaricaulota bacterium]|nr:primosomal protein N' [Candidatus Bipolaricaulota bacterium]
MIASVLLSLPIDHPFDFAVGDNLKEAIAVGKRVIVRFHGKEKTGIVESLAEKSEHPGPLEPVLSVQPNPSFTPDALSFCLETAAHYLSSPGLFVNRLLPRTANTHRERYLQATGKLDEIAMNIESRSVRAPRQAEVLRFLLARRGPCAETDLRERLHTPNSVINRLVDLGLIEEAHPRSTFSQMTSLEGVRAMDAMTPNEKAHTLLFSRSRIGEYIKAIEETLASGKSVLLLAPEILIARGIFVNLQRSLSVPVALYHSGVAEGEKGRVWNDVLHGRARIVVGTRSALFLPFFHLGLVIVDEEQDRSYKQDEMIPHYHARDVVTWRGDIRAIFGSAAPAIETFYRAQMEEIHLTRKPVAQEAQNATIIDMRKEKGTLSDALLDAIAETLAAGKRVLIGVNARGHFQAVLCKKCGQPLRCPHCGANLTYDVRSSQLVCRVCGIAQPRMTCPNCGGRSLRFVGIGSERIEEEMRVRFPNARIARIDGTSLANKTAVTRAEAAIEGAAQIIVGTPLATKGPIIHGLGLAAAIGSDAILARPDFRATERTYQYLTGLFGRLDEGGGAIVQTGYPDHFAVAAGIRGDYDLLYAREIAEREAMFYPPFSHLARIIIPHARSTDRLGRILSEYDVQIIGPAPHPWHHGQDVVLIKGRDASVVRAACARVHAEIPGKGGNTVEVDINPEQL